MNDIVKTDEIHELRVNAQNFQKRLHSKPKGNEIKTNEHANNSKYLPISFLEMTLDELFFGLWQTKDFKSQVIANEVIGSLILSYFHPVYHIWIERVGAGAVMIQYKSKGKGGSGDITNIKDKIPNTLTKDYPHLKAECFRNACLSIGKSFGRDLNRNYTDDYQPLILEKVPELLLEEKLKGELDKYNDPITLEKDKLKLRDKYVKLGMNKKEATEIIQGCLNDF